MISVDTNVLVYAVNSADPNHEAARVFLAAAVEHDVVALPWPVCYEFLRVVTHRRVLPHPLTTRQAWKFINTLMASPRIATLGAGPDHAKYVEKVLEVPGVAGNLVHDAHIAAILTEHGIRDFWTRDQDFRRFTWLRIRDPLVETPLRY